MNEQWLSIVDYARTFNVSDMTIRRRIKTGRLKAVLQDGKYYIPVHATERERQAMQSGQPSQPEPSYHDTKTSFSREMLVIKGHPEPNRTVAEALENRSQPHHSIQSSVLGRRDGENPRPYLGHQDSRAEEVIPKNLVMPISQSENTLVDSRALLAYCEATLRKANDQERKAIDRFKSKLEALEATLEGRDQEIKSLRQQVEDLQLLVKIMERRKT